MRPSRLLLYALELFEQFGPFDSSIFSRLEAIRPIERSGGRLGCATAELSLSALLSDMEGGVHVRSRGDMKVAYSTDTVQAILERSEC